jgi:hypothetical protein
MADGSLDERALVLKLVERWHLSVPERRSLPGGRAKRSLVLAAIERLVRDHGAATVRAEGPFVELRRVEGGACEVTWSDETSLSKWEILKRARFPTIAETAAAAIAHVRHIDGVPVDPTA